LDEEDVAADRRPGEAGGDAGDAGALRDLRLEAGGAQDLRDVAGIDADALGRPFGDPGGGVAKDRAYRPLQVANAGFARVVGDDGAQGGLGDLALLRLQPVLLQLPGHQIAPRDLQLFADRVARQLDHLHAVEQWARDRVELIRGRDEQHFAEIE